jgi:hypothetical protein
MFLGFDATNATGDLSFIQPSTTRPSALVRCRGWPQFHLIVTSCTRPPITQGAARGKGERRHGTGGQAGPFGFLGSFKSNGSCVGCGSKCSAHLRHMPWLILQAKSGWDKVRPHQEQMVFVINRHSAVWIQDFSRRYSFMPSLLAGYCSAEGEHQSGKPCDTIRGG